VDSIVLWLTLCFEQGEKPKISKAPKRGLGEQRDSDLVRDQAQGKREGLGSMIGNRLGGREWRTRTEALSRWNKAVRQGVFQRGDAISLVMRGGRVWF